MKAQHHESLFTSRAAGPVSIYRPIDGVMQLVEVKPAGTLETARITEGAKRGPKPGAKNAKPDAAKFAESENDF